MAKKKSKKSEFRLKPWCWYCLREFDDERVLLQHQKSKHFKCNHCPRKLNTAGGLMVHCQQVHKVEPDKLPNTLPGRDGYDIEIFGMEGIPARDQAEWKAKKEAEWGVSLDALRRQQGPKRPRIYKGVIGEAEIQALLEQHKKLMSGGNKAAAGQNGAAGVVAPPLMPGMPPPTLGMPPPTLMPGAGMPPPFPGYPASSAMSMPPFAPPPSQQQAFAGSPSPFPPPPGGIMPPPGWRPGMPPMMPFAAGAPVGVSPVAPSPSSAISTPAAAAAPATAAPAAASSSNGGIVDATIVPPKDGFMWPDAEASPAEKRALQPRYRYTSPTPGGAGEGTAAVGSKRKAAADFLE